MKRVVYNLTGKSNVVFNIAHLSVESKHVYTPVVDGLNPHEEMIWYEAVLTIITFNF